MAIRQNTILIKGSNVPGKIPSPGDLQLKELALNFADVILYASGTTANSILPIGWDRVARTGDTMTGTLYVPTISATTYQNLPIDIRVTGGTYTAGTAIFTNNTGGTFTVTGFTTGSTSGGGGAGGKLFYFNLSNTQSPYKEISETPTNVSEQTSAATISNGVTATIASFLSPTNIPNITSIPSGIWSFFLHSYKENGNASFDIFCEVYKRTSGGTETLLFSSDPEPVNSNSPTASMQISDIYYSGTSLNISDRILVKVRATNTSNQSHTITFITEGTSHYSYFRTSFGNINDTFVTGFTYANNVFTIKQNQGQPDLSVLANIMTGLTINGNITITGDTTSKSLSATTLSSTTLTVSGITFNKLLKEKVGSVAGSGFTGNPKTYALTFGTNFADTNYAIMITGPANRTYTYESQATSGFTINANANGAITGNVYWIAKQIGEV